MYLVAGSFSLYVRILSEAAKSSEDLLGWGWRCVCVHAGVRMRWAPTCSCHRAMARVLFIWGGLGPSRCFPRAVVTVYNQFTILPAFNFLSDPD